MKINECDLDRAMRINLGVALLILVASGNAGAWAWIGVVPLVTGMIGNCPLYSILGFKTTAAAS
jgi:hypothetical protein